MSGEDCAVELFWLPVAAGTASRVREWSLSAWEAADAVLHRRPRGRLYHSALKVRVDGRMHTLEMTPAFSGDGESARMTGPVGFHGADRWRAFRYELRCFEAAELPDEAWAVAGPIELSSECGSARDVLGLTVDVPPHTWGRRAPGTSEMWTSDSTVSWLLARAGLNPERLTLPSGGRAPGWNAGMEAARR